MTHVEDHGGRDVELTPVDGPMDGEVEDPAGPVDLLGPRVSREDDGYHLHMRQVVPVDREAVWAFFEDLGHLERIVPERFGLEVVESSGDRVEEGVRIVHRQRVRGVPVTWVSRIGDVVEGRRFTDEMEEGPFASWRHVHSLREVQGGTAIVDDVTYRLPLEPLSRVVHPVVARDLRGLFRERALAVARALGGGEVEGTEDL